MEYIVKCLILLWNLYALGDDYVNLFSIFYIVPFLLFLLRNKFINVRIDTTLDILNGYIYMVSKDFGVWQPS